jgi:phage tail-like protein
MSETAIETPAYPFTSFNFEVDVTLEDSAERLCRAAFAECDGLELTMEVKTIREGGNNGVQHRLTGPWAYGTLTLKRGMTSSFDLWDWVERLDVDPSVRANAEVVVFSADRTKKQAVFSLKRCVPVKLKAPPLNAKDGMVAIEELQLAYESLKLRPEGAA